VGLLEVKVGHETQNRDLCMYRLYVAGCWALYALATALPAMTSADPIMTLVQLTCPIMLISFYPLSLYLALLANAATYALVGLIVETLRQQFHHAS
jgi:hypothetical protein